MAEQHFPSPVIEALVQVITGGPGTQANRGSIGHYRSGPELEAFLGEAGIELHIGSESRLPSVRKALQHANGSPQGREALVRLMEAVADPRLYLGEPERGKAVVDYLNERLTYERLELRIVGQVYRLRSRALGSVVVDQLHEAAAALNLSSVIADLDARAGP